MADLFLDTEVRWFLPLAAWTAVEAGYSVSEMERILLEEVAPVVGSNLIDIAGEWAGFDSEWLCQQIENNLRSRLPVVERAKGLVIGVMIKDVRSALRSLHDAFEQAQDREDLLCQLKPMVYLFVEQDWTRLISLWSNVKQLSRWPWKALEETLDWVLEPAYQAWPDGRSNWDWLGEFYSWAAQLPMPMAETMELCEQLSYFYVIENLLDTPRGGMVREALEGQPLDRLQSMLLDGPLRDFYPERERARANWERWITPPE